MAQVLKQDVRNRILDAALRSFASHGFAAATMRQVAAEAGISTGNLYRYFEGKDVLFEEVMPTEFIAALQTLLERRVKSLRGVGDIRTLPPDAEFYLVSEELMRFCLQHRLRVVVLLAKSEGSMHAAFGRQTVNRLVAMAVEHARSVGRPSRLSPPDRFALEQVYENFVATIVRVLTRYKDEKSIRAAIRGFERYHLAGLKSFFEGDAQ